jgi:hypothetical protein
MTAANTKHGNFSAYARAERHHVRTLTARNRLTCAATLLWPYLPPDMAARLARGPAELCAPVHPSNLPYLTPQDATACNVKTRPGKPAPKPTGRAAERLAVRAEAAAQAPWREAIAQARATKRAVHRESSPSPLAGLGREERTKGRGEGSTRNAVQRGNADPTTPAPTPATRQHLTLLQRELAFRLAGLRGPRCAPPQTDAARTPQAAPNPPRTKSPGRIAIQRDPAAHPGRATPPTARPSAPSVPPHPASHQPSVPAAAHQWRPPLAARQTKTAGRIAVQRENPTPPPLTRLTPTNAEALCTTTLANTRTPDLSTQLAQRFGHPSPAPGWRIPHATPAADPVANAVRSFLAKHKRPNGPAAS